MEEPEEVVDNDHNTRRYEWDRGEGYERPSVGKVLEVYQVANYWEKNESKRQGVEPVQQDVQGYDDLRLELNEGRDRVPRQAHVDAPLSNNFGDARMFFNEFRDIEQAASWFHII